MIGGLETKRILERLKIGRVTYDCQNAHVVIDGRQRVRCVLGKKLTNSKDGTMDLNLVNLGRTAFVCLACWGFSDGRD